MKPLEVHCRNRVLYVRMTIDDKSMGMRDYYLYDNETNNKPDVFPDADLKLIA